MPDTYQMSLRMTALQWRRLHQMVHRSVDLKNQDDVDIYGAVDTRLKEAELICDTPDSQSTSTTKTRRRRKRSATG